MRVDLHTHTWYSPDGMLEPERLLDLAKRRGLHAVAVTDHNRLTHIRSGDPLVIPGEEVRTGKGELIGLFLTEEIPPGLSPEETADRIREQGGLVLIPHPFDLFRFRTAAPLLGYKPRKDDLLEVLNARYVCKSFEERAFEYAERWGLPKVGGSDAHTPVEVGRAWTEVPEFSDAEELYSHLRKGRTHPAGKLSPPWVHLTVIPLKLLHIIRALP